MASFLTKTMTNIAVNKTKSAVTTMAVGATTTMIAKSLGLDDSLVGRVLMVGAPMMILAGADDPGISGKLFGNAKQKDKKKAKKGRKEAEQDYFNVFGNKGHEMNKAIAEETGATEDEVSGIMSLFLPDFEKAIAEEDLEDEGAMSKLFKKEAQDAKKQNPSFARTAMKVVF